MTNPQHILLWELFKQDGKTHRRSVFIHKDELKNAIFVKKSENTGEVMYSVMLSGYTEPKMLVSAESIMEGLV